MELQQLQQLLVNIGLQVLNYIRQLVFLLLYHFSIQEVANLFALLSLKVARYFSYNCLVFLILMTLFSGFLLFSFLPQQFFFLPLLVVFFLPQLFFFLPLLVVFFLPQQFFFLPLLVVFFLPLIFSLLLLFSSVLMLFVSRVRFVRIVLQNHLGKQSLEFFDLSVRHYFSLDWQVSRFYLLSCRSESKYSGIPTV